jgi:hypothetical protein
LVKHEAPFADRTSQAIPDEPSTNVSFSQVPTAQAPPSPQRDAHNGHVPASPDGQGSSMQARPAPQSLFVAHAFVHMPTTLGVDDVFDRLRTE